MLYIVVLVVLTSAAAFADDAPKPPAPAKNLEAIQKQHEEAQKAIIKAMQALPDTKEGNETAERLWEAFDKGQAERFAAAVEIAKADPKSDAGFAALEWVLAIPRSYYLPPGISAMEHAARHHAANPKVGKIVAVLGRVPPHEQLNPKEHAAAMALIKAVAEKNPDRAARGQAVMALAWQAKGRFALAEYKRAPEVDVLAAEAEKAFEAVLKDYADCPRLVQGGKEKLGNRAKEELYELRHLRIGKVAPDIEAEDLDGVKFKLSDSRGKVTVVVFWATWCGPCMAMVPHERKLVDRLKDKPFVLVGVNGDGDRATAKKVAEKEKITWRSFWSGPEDGERTISKAWNVHAWPTIYVLDPRGVIRYKNVRFGELDEAVDALLKEVEEK